MQFSLLHISIDLALELWPWRWLWELFLFPTYVGAFKCTGAGVLKWLLRGECTSSLRNGFQYLQITIVPMQQHLNFWLSTVDYQQVVLCDPGGQYFIVGCKSLGCWLQLEVNQRVLYLVKKSQGRYKQFMKQRIYQWAWCYGNIQLPKQFVWFKSMGMAASISSIEAEANRSSVELVLAKPTKYFAQMKRSGSITLKHHTFTNGIQIKLFQGV